MSNENMQNRGKVIDREVVDVDGAPVTMEIRQLDPMRAPARYSVKRTETVLSDGSKVSHYDVLDAAAHNETIRRCGTNTEALQYITEQRKYQVSHTPNCFFVWSSNSTVAIAKFDTLTGARNYIGKVIKFPVKLTRKKTEVSGPQKGGGQKKAK